MKIFVTGAYGPTGEFEPLHEAGHEVVLGRPVDQPGRQPYPEVELIEASRVPTPENFVGVAAAARWRERFTQAKVRGTR